MVTAGREGERLSLVGLSVGRGGSDGSGLKQAGLQPVWPCVCRCRLMSRFSRISLTSGRMR
jgi:hypothetical protein